jgi:hypothetical protein
MTAQQGPPFRFADSRRLRLARLGYPRFVVPGIGIIRFPGEPGEGDLSGVRVLSFRDTAEQIDKTVIVKPPCFCAHGDA